MITLWHSVMFWRFTFQYGSINTISPLFAISTYSSLHSNMVLLIRGCGNWLFKQVFFTFQYGSINTTFMPTCTDLHLSLHSNMVLLILRCAQTGISIQDSLHSNMVLLILVFHKCLSHKHYSTTFCRPCHFLFFRDP